jgi:hypothetical protein
MIGTITTPHLMVLNTPHLFELQWNNERLGFAALEAKSQTHAVA